jgi:peptide-methionine (R)-S-oxide reductase
MCRSQPNRRSLLLAAFSIGAGYAVGAPAVAAIADPFAGSPWRKISDAEWRKRLSPAAFEIMRRDGTEPPGSSPLNTEHRLGVFNCAGCGLTLFKSEWKFESGTGWPSFYTVYKENIGVKRDTLLGYERTEYHCAQCLGHQGHIFRDGPKPTGLRHCNDGVALKFVPA